MIPNLAPASPCSPDVMEILFPSRGPSTISAAAARVLPARTLLKSQNQVFSAAAGWLTTRHGFAKTAWVNSDQQILKWKGKGRGGESDLASIW